MSKQSEQEEGDGGRAGARYEEHRGYRWCQRKGRGNSGTHVPSTLPVTSQKRGKGQSMNSWS